MNPRSSDQYVIDVSWVLIMILLILVVIITIINESQTRVMANMFLIFFTILMIIRGVIITE